MAEPGQLKTPSPRRTLIDIALRRQRPGTGSNLRRGDTALREWPDLSETLTGLPWAVCGGVATRNYMPERGTQDLDLLVREEDLAAVEGRLRAAGFAFSGPLTIGGSTWRSPEGTPIDLIEGSGAWVDEALQLAVSNRDQQGLPVLTLPFLVLMKLEADRIVDGGDIARMLGMADEQTRNSVRSVVQQHGADFMDDLESIIALGKVEFGNG
jgi:hypothetical protein